MLRRRFEWDVRKAASNAQKHRVRFEQAATAFDDPFALIADDDDHSDDEHRQQLIGLGESGLLLVVFTERGDQADSVYRLISARKATKREKKAYEAYRNVPI